MSLDTKGALRFIIENMRTILILKFPYKNMQEREILVTAYSKQYLSKCINIAIAENIQDGKEIKALIKASMKASIDRISESDKFFNFDFLEKTIKEIATKDRLNILEKEALNSYQFFESKLLYLNDTTNYRFANGILGAVVQRLGGVNNIVAKVVKGGLTNSYNSYALDNFKKDFIKMYKIVRFAIKKGELEPVFLIEGKFGKNGITRKLEQKAIITAGQLGASAYKMIEGA